MSELPPVIGIGGPSLIDSLFNCTFGICKMPVSNTKIQLCIHFESGFIGECSNEAVAETCTAGMLFECHRKPELATVLIDAFMPSLTKEPIIIYPLQSNEGRRSSRILSIDEMASNKDHKRELHKVTMAMYLGGIGALLASEALEECNEDVECQLAWTEFQYQTEDLVYDALKTIRDFAEGTIIFIGQTVENVSSFFQKTFFAENESIKSEYDYFTLVIYVMNYSLTATFY